MAARPRNSRSGERRPVYIVSACLAGIDCTYRGSSKLNASVKRLVAEGRAVPVCPEVMGGLTTPRENAEIAGGDGAAALAGRARVISVTGKDVSANYMRGAQAALGIAKRAGIRRAILKSKSPACGRGRVYDGSFRKTLTAGNGVLAALLLKHRFTVLTENDI